MKPVIDKPSKLFQRMSCASDRRDTSTAPVSAVVQRSILPLLASSEYAFHGAFGDVRLKLSSLLFGLHSTPCTEPGGTPFTRVAALVRVSSR
jgi:hypothetical protein